MSPYRSIADRATARMPLTTRVRAAGGRGRGVPGRPGPLGAAGARSWVYLPFRLIITAAAVLLFDQAVFAGQFLAGTFGALHTHRENATYAGLTTLGAAIAAIPIRWPGGGPLWPLCACLGLFGLIALQIALGFARTLTIHIPLGVSIIVLAVLLVIWAWRPHHITAPATALPDAAPGAAGWA